MPRDTLRGVDLSCDFQRPGHQLNERASDGFERECECDRDLLEVADVCAVGDTGVRLTLPDGRQLLHFHDVALLIATFRRQVGTVLLSRYSVLRIPVDGGAVKLPLAQRMTTHCRLIERRRRAMYAAFDSLVREEVDGGAFAAVTGPHIGTLDGAFPVPPPTDRPLTCTSQEPGHCINPFVDYKMSPVLAEEPLVEAAIVEAGNRIVLSIEGVPHVLHSHDPWGLLLAIRAGRATRWNTPHPMLLVEQPDGRSSLLKVTHDPLVACEDSAAEGARYAAWLAERTGHVGVEDSGGEEGERDG